MEEHSTRANPRKRIVPRGREYVTARTIKKMKINCGICLTWLYSVILWVQMKEESTSENAQNAKENARFSSFKETATAKEKAK